MSIETFCKKNENIIDIKKTKLKLYKTHTEIQKIIKQNKLYNYLKNNILKH